MGFLGSLIDDILDTPGKVVRKVTSTVEELACAATGSHEWGGWDHLSNGRKHGDWCVLAAVEHGRWSASGESRPPWINLYLSALAALGLIQKADVQPYRDWLIAERHRRDEDAEREKLVELIDKYGLPKRRERP